MIERERIVEMISACSLHFKGKYDYKRYRGKKKSATAPNMMMLAVAKTLQQQFTTEEQLERHMALTFFRTNRIWFDNVAKPESLTFTKNFNAKVESVEYYCEELSEWIKANGGFHRCLFETEFAAPLLTDAFGGRVHPLGFFLLLNISKAHEKWEHFMWKANSQKVLKTMQLLNLDYNLHVVRSAQTLRRLL